MYSITLSLSTEMFLPSGFSSITLASPNSSEAIVKSKPLINKQSKIYIRFLCMLIKVLIRHDEYLPSSDQSPTKLFSFNKFLWRSGSSVAK